jgi:hypothetical protein
MDKPLHSCMTKAVIADGDQLETGPRWITARRGILRLYPDRLTCGNWTLPYDTLRAAELVKIRSPVLRIPGYVLSVRTDAQTYHFGLNAGRYWQGELPFPAMRREARLRMSPISFAARLLLAGCVAYYCWRRLTT